MKMKRRLKRSTRQYIIVAVICIVVIGGAATATSVIITGQVRENYRNLLQKAYQDMQANQREVYVTTADIHSGDLIKAEMLEKRTVYSSQSQGTYLTREEIGKTALIDLPSGTQMMNTMVTDNQVAANIREIEYQVITMNSNIIANDTVDVRIFYPNGESYVVLSKKKIMSYVPETMSVFLWIDEAELLRMSAAIVDAALYTGSKLYVTKYIEPNFQEASVITYAPGLSILSLIENDPNIIERCSQELNKNIRKALENRLADNMETDLSAINWKVDPNNAYLQMPEGTEEAARAEPEGAPEEVKADTDTQKMQEEAITPIPSGMPQNIKEKDKRDKDKELGSADYFYMVKDAKDNEVEYGE